MTSGLILVVFQLALPNFLMLLGISMVFHLPPQCVVLIQRPNVKVGCNNECIFCYNQAAHQPVSQSTNEC